MTCLPPPQTPKGQRISTKKKRGKNVRVRRKPFTLCLSLYSTYLHVVHAARARGQQRSARRKRENEKKPTWILHRRALRRHVIVVRVYPHFTCPTPSNEKSTVRKHGKEWRPKHDHVATSTQQLIAVNKETRNARRNLSLSQRESALGARRFVSFANSQAASSWSESRFSTIRSALIA